MSNVSVKFVGLDKLEAKLLKNAQLKEAKAIVQDNGEAMQKKAIRNTENFTGHYVGKKFVKPTGATKKSISTNSGPFDGEMSYRVATSQEYGIYPELGTRFMSARPYIGPAYMDVVSKFEKDMKGLVK